MKKELVWLQGMIPAGQVLPVRAQYRVIRFLPLTNTYDVIPVLRDGRLRLDAVPARPGGNDRVRVMTGRKPQRDQRLAEPARRGEDRVRDDVLGPGEQLVQVHQYASGSALLLDTFYAQHVAEQFGLPTWSTCRITGRCVTIRRRRGSTTSVSAPAGKVRRKSGRVVATWTAETSLGLGLRLVIIQAEPVSNIANPTLDSEVAMRMTMKAGLPSRLRRGSALDGVFGSTFSSVVKSSARYPDTVRPLDLRARIERLWQARLRGSGTSIGSAPRLQVFPEECARTRKRASAGLEARVPERPGVDHVRPYLEGRRDVGRAPGGSEADSIIEQSLGRTDLNEGRRQSLEIRVERRKARVFPVHPSRDIGVGQPLQVPFLNERIDGAFARERRARHGEIDPRRQEPETAGQILARALELPDQSERQIRARAVAPDRNVFGRVAVAAQAPPDGRARRRARPEKDARARGGRQGPTCAGPLPVRPRSPVGGG